MKIVFLMRFDFNQKSGGDVVQINAYVKELRLLGHECYLSSGFSREKLIDCDVFFLVNIDKPIETIYYFNLVKKHFPGKPIFLVPIHHPIRAIEKFERFEKGNVFKYFCLLFPDFYAREKIKNFVRFRKQAKYLLVSFRHLFFGYRCLIRDMVTSVNGVIYISEGEKKSVHQDFNCVARRSVVAYNAVDISETVPTESIRDIDIVVVGRIEPRKNQLRIAKIFSSRSDHIIFIGAANRNSDDYSGDFIESIELSNNKNMKYVGVLPHAEVLQFMRRSRLLLNASYFEVNPLIDLEAALAGCEVITTMNSYTRESIPGVVEVDPWSDKSILSAVDSLLSTNVDKENAYNINTSWAESAAKINELITS